MKSRVVFTMVRDEKVLLPVWEKYYRRFFKNVHIINHNTKDSDGKVYLDYRVKVISEYQKKLLQRFDWVVFVDVDEFLVPDPDKYSGLDDFINKAWGSYIYCTGREILQEEEEKPIDWNKPILAQRTYWWPHIACYKPAISQVELDYANGFHYAKRDLKDANSKGRHFKEHIQNIANPDIYLIHIKQIDRDLVRTRARPKANVEGKQLIPDKWKEGF